MLAHALVTAPGAQPARWILFLHGILGSGANWRTFAKNVVADVPSYGAVLVDLRLHGDSQNVPPPHTVHAAAEDVRALVSSLPGPVPAVLAHSFGGKVALDYARTASDLEDLFVVDATPGPRPDGRGSESTRHIVELLRDLPPEFADRNAFTAWIEARGVSRPIAMWLAMNVRPVPNTTRFVFRVDIDGIRALLADYFAVDLWDVLEVPRRLKVHLVVGGKSGVVDAADQARAHRAPNATVDLIESAGHWVHVDSPDALRRVVVDQLKTRE